MTAPLSLLARYRWELVAVLVLTSAACSSNTAEFPSDRDLDIWTMSLGTDLVRGTGYSRVLSHPGGDALLIGAQGETIPQEEGDGAVPRVENWRLILARVSPENPGEDWQVTTDLQAVPYDVFVDEEGDLIGTLGFVNDGYGDQPQEFGAAKFSAAEGTLLWSTSLEGIRPQAHVTLDGDLLIAATADNEQADSSVLTLISGEDGSVIWTKAADPERSFSFSAIGSDDDFFVSWDNAPRPDMWISRHSLADGSEFWTRDVSESGEPGEVFAISSGAALLEVGNTEGEYRTSVKYQSYSAAEGTELFTKLPRNEHGEYPMVTSPIIGEGSFFTLSGSIFREFANDDGSNVWSSARLFDDSSEPSFFSRDGAGVLFAFSDAEGGQRIAAATPGSTSLDFNYKFKSDGIFDTTGTTSGVYLLTKKDLPSDQFYSSYYDQTLLRVVPK